MWYQVKSKQIILTCKVKPNAKKTAIVARTDDYLRIALHAPPVDGAANLALVNFLAELFQLPKREVVILRGQKSRMKIVALPYTSQLQIYLTTLIV